jgi:hypothetical protein
MGCEREQCPAEDAEPDDVEKNADDEHGDGSRDKGCEGRAFHHHHGAALRIVDPVGVWNPLRRGCFAVVPCRGGKRAGPNRVPRWSWCHAGVSVRLHFGAARIVVASARLVLRRLRAAVAEFPHRDAELTRLVSQVLLNASAGEDDDADR